MSDERYEAPAVENTTPVEAPLNTTTNQSEPQTLTPVWRRSARDDGAPLDGS